MTKGVDEKCVLVELVAKSTGNSIRDAELTDILTQSHGAQAGNLSVSKKLYGDYLNPVSAAYADLRKFFKSMTYAWDRNKRLCPLVDFSNPKRLYFKEFEQGIRERVIKADQAVAEFLGRYDEILATAPNRLGTSFKSDDFPSKEALEAKFGVVWEATPVPSDDWRVGINAEMEDMIREKVGKQKEAGYSRVSLEIMNGTREMITWVLEKMSDESSELKAETMEKVLKQVEHMKAFPASEEATAILGAMNSIIGKFSTSAIVGNPGVKQYVKDKVTQLGEAMGVAKPATPENPPAEPEVVENQGQTTFDAAAVSTQFPDPPKKSKKGKKTKSEADLDAEAQAEYDRKLEAELEAKLSGKEGVL